MTIQSRTSEQERLTAAREQGVPWRKWGPYLSERQWGTVREDYSDSGNAWDYFSHDQARSRAYRWGEDGLAGISDDRQLLCFALALWNGRDPILKERLFGLTNSEGNHGEDVKEYYFYLDSTPTHSYMKYLYKYPQAEFPYGDLVETNRRRGKHDFEYELLDTGVFDQDRYFDVFVEYAKAAPEDLLIQVTVTNRGPEAATLHVLPTLWFRNTWSWGGDAPRPALRQAATGATAVIAASHPELGERFLSCEDAAALLFTENETNVERLFRSPNRTPYRQGRDQRVSRPRPPGGRQPRPDGDEGRRALSAHRGARRLRDAAAAPQRRGAGRADVAGRRTGGASQPRFRRDDGHAPEGSRRVLRLGHPGIARRRFDQRDAPGAGRDAVVQAVLPLRRRPVARGARRRALQGGEARRPPQRPLAPHAQRRRDLHAGQVGVPVVRGVGPGLPLSRPDARRRGLRQAPAGPDAAGPVPPPQRADPRLRVELRRRQPTGARLGHALHVRGRQGAAGEGGHRLAGARVPEAPAQLHLVGEPQGPRRQ